MKILIINMTSIYHNTSAVQRMCGIIRGLSKNGHECDLMCMKAQKDDYLYDESNMKSTEAYVKKIYFFDCVKTYGGLAAKKGMVKGNFYRNSVAILKKLLKKSFSLINPYDSQVVNVKNVLKLNIEYDRYQYIISISDPKSSHRIVLELIKKKLIKHPEERWIQYWGDPWAIDIMGGKKGNRRIKKEEEKIIGLSKKTIYTSPFTLGYQKECFSRYKEKMSYVNQPCIEGNSNMNESMQRMDYILYAGSYGTKYRNISNIYSCCKKNKYRLKIAGKSDDIVFKDCENIEILGKVQLDAAIRMEQEASILVCVCNLRGTQIPGKIFYQAGYKKPIIIVVDGEYKEKMREYFSSFNRYIICNNSEEDIRDAIKTAYKEIETNREYVLDERFRETYCADKILKKTTEVCRNG